MSPELRWSVVERVVGLFGIPEIGASLAPGHWRSEPPCTALVVAPRSVEPGRRQC